MKDIFSIISFFLLLSVAFSNCYYDNKEDLYQYNIIDNQSGACEITTVSYKNDIAPILNLQCNAACHNANDRFGNVVLDEYNKVIPYVNNGKLMGTIKHEPGFIIMPTSGRKIPSCDIKKLDAWIIDGAKNN